MKCCGYDSRDCIYNTLFPTSCANGPNKLLCYYTLRKRLVRYKHSILLNLLSVTKKIKSCEPDSKAQCYKICYSRNLRIFVMS
jgi:hypothetical protein